MGLLLKQDADAVTEVKDKKARLLSLNENILSLMEKQRSEPVYKKILIAKAVCVKLFIYCHFVFFYV